MLNLGLRPKKLVFRPDRGGTPQGLAKPARGVKPKAGSDFFMGQGKLPSKK